MKRTPPEVPDPETDDAPGTTPRVPFLLGVLPLYALVLLSLASWWWTMALFFDVGDVLAGTLVGFAFPGLLSAVSLLGSLRRRARGGGTAAPFLTMGILAAVFVSFAAGHAYGNAPRPALDAATFLGIAFIAGAVSLMLHPLGGLASYYEYKDPRFLGGVVFMPLFIYLSVVFQASLEWEVRTALLVAGFGGFWVSGAWLASRFTQGAYVPGLEVRPTVAFRPDLILPGGVLLVKGIVLTGVGLMLMFQPLLAFPQWNWWGFALAFWGIITIIPLRGLYKLLVGRRRRLLGTGGTSLGFVWAKESLLFLGLLVLLYGFLNAFMGTVPFLGLRPQPETFSAGLVLLLAAYLVLVPFRGYLKTLVPEGTESFVFLVTKGGVLLLGILVLMYALIAWFMGAFPVPHPASKPVGFAVGAVLALLGSVLVVVLRPVALANEFRATLRIMVGILADAPESVREELMQRRLRFLASCPEKQRNRQVAVMLSDLHLLPEAKRGRLLASQMKLLAEMEAPDRATLMRAMDAAREGGGA